MKKAIWNGLSGISVTAFLLLVCCIDTEGAVGNVIAVLSVVALTITVFSLNMLRITYQREALDKRIRDFRVKK